MLRDIYIQFSILANQPPYKTPGLSTRIGFEYQNPQLNPPNDFSVRQSVPGTRCIFAPRFFSPLRYCLETVKHYQVLFNISNIICSLSLCLSKGLCYFSIIDMQNFGNYRIKDVHHPAANANPLTKLHGLALVQNPTLLAPRQKQAAGYNSFGGFILATFTSYTSNIEHIEYSVCVCYPGAVGSFFLCSSVEVITLESDYLLSVVISRLAGRGNHPFHVFYTRICNKHSTCLYASNS